MKKNVVEIVALLAMCQVSGTSAVMAASPDAENLSQQTLKGLSFLPGHWKGKGSSGVLVEEYWSAPEGDSLIGHCRFIKEGKTTFYELLTVVKTERGIVLRMRHFNKSLVAWADDEEAGDCWLTKCTPTEIVFDNGSSKHSVKVVYRKTGVGSMSTVVEDTKDGKTALYPFDYHLIEQSKIE